MPIVTTKSGQARQDLIGLFEQAQAAVLAARATATELQEAIDLAVVAPAPGDDGVRISTEAWERLRDCASSKT